MIKTAYIFMEFQKDFLSSEGKLNISQKGSNFLENAQKILQFAREKNQPIIHVHLLFNADYSELREDINGVLSLVKQTKAFQKGSDGVKPITQFLPQGKEIQLFKNSISSFEGTNLEQQLKEMERDRPFSSYERHKTI